MSIQDFGRYGYRKYGIPVSGAMDLNSALLANALVNVPLNSPVIEMYLSGHQLFFEKPGFISLTGADGDFFLNEQRVEKNILIEVIKDDVLDIGKLSNGSRVYLAIQGIIQSKKIFKSHSGIPGVFSSKLHKGDLIIVDFISRAPSNQNSSISPFLFDTTLPIHVCEGPEYDRLSRAEISMLMNQVYEISRQSDRMGFRLQGVPAKFNNSRKGILSSPVMPGTVQLLPSGLPLILMRDCQTTGGYLRVLQIDADDINILGQRQPGDTVSFSLLEDTLNQERDSISYVKSKKK